MKISRNFDPFDGLNRIIIKQLPNFRQIPDRVVGVGSGRAIRVWRYFFILPDRVRFAKLQPVDHPLRWSDREGRLINFGRRVRSGLSSLQDNQIISNIHNHKQKQNCQKFDIKTQSQTQTHFLSRFGEISPDPATKIQEITRSGEIGNH